MATACGGWQEHQLPSIPSPEWFVFKVLVVVVALERLFHVGRGEREPVLKCGGVAHRGVQEIAKHKIWH